MPVLLLLHGMLGGWDELIILGAGVLLAIVVVKMTKRTPVTDVEDEDVGAGIEPSAKTDDPR